MRPFHGMAMLRPSLLARVLAPHVVLLALVAGCGSAKSGGPPPPPWKEGPGPSEPDFMHIGAIEPAPADPAPTPTATATAAASATPVVPPVPLEKKPKDTAAADPSPTKTVDEVPGPEGRTESSSPQKKPTLKAAVVDSSGGLSEEDVRAAIASSRASLRRCYDLGVRAAPDFAGSVTMRVAINPAGSVAQADVLASSTRNQSVDACVRDEIRKLVFKATGSGAVVAFPIEFGR